MVMRTGFTRLKSNFSHGKLNENFNLIFLVKAAVNFRDLQISKVFTTSANRIFPISFKVMCISFGYKYFEKRVNLVTSLG